MGWLASLRELEPAALDVPLYMLRLEKKTEILESAGVRTLSDLLEAYCEQRLLRIASVGRATVEEVEKRFSALATAADAEGRAIDWQRYAVSLGYQLVPEHEVASGADFLAELPRVAGAIIEFHENQVERLILTDRLMRQPESRLTLEELGQRAEPRPISRERVRQLESRLLGALSNALLFDNYRELPFHFRSTFSEWWKKAFRHFSGQSQLPFHEFMTGLEETWEVSAHELFPHLPLITGILTSKATVPPQLRQGMRLSPRFYGKLSPALTSRPIEWLALGKVRDELVEDGIATIGDLIASGLSGSLPPVSTRAGQICRKTLDAVSEALTDYGTVDWRTFGAAVGLRPVPVPERTTPMAFLHHLNDDLEEIVRVNATSGRAADIFRLRTCLPQTSRRTLAEVAELLHSHGPSIKREESLLLEALHTQLVGRDFTFCRVLFPTRFLWFWQNAWKVYLRDRSSYLTFCHSLACHWQVPLNIAIENAEALWAVFARYPNGRRSPAPMRRVRCTREEFTGGTIMLRGFRRAH